MLTAKRKIEILRCYQAVAANARILNDEDGHIGYFTGTFPIHSGERPDAIVSELKALCAELEIPLQDCELKHSWLSLPGSGPRFIEASFSAAAQYNPPLEEKINARINDLHRQAKPGTPEEKATQDLLNMANSIHTHALPADEMRGIIDRLLDAGADTSATQYGLSVYQLATTAENWEFIECLRTVAKTYNIVWPPGSGRQRSSASSGKSP